MMSSPASRAGALLLVVSVHLLAAPVARAEDRALHITARNKYEIIGQVDGQEVTLPLPDVVGISGRMVATNRADAKVVLRDGRTLEVAHAAIRVPGGWNDPNRTFQRREDGSATFHGDVTSLDDLFRFISDGDTSARVRAVPQQHLVGAATRRATRAIAAYRARGEKAELAEVQAAAARLRAAIGDGDAPPSARKALAELGAIATGHERAELKRNHGAVRGEVVAALREAEAGRGPLAPAAIAADPAAARKEFDRVIRPYWHASGRGRHLGKIDRKLRRIYSRVAIDLHHAESRQALPEVPESLAPFVARDVTALAMQGKLDPVVGRKTEIRGLAQGLAGRTKRNVIVVGEPGVGKSALVDGLALNIVRGDVPPAVRGKRVLEISMARLTAGTMYRGQFEERLQNMLKALADIPEAERPILFIDEGHTIIGAGAAEGSVDASNILKPALARGELQVITATTLDEYRKYVKKDRALERRFRPLFVAEPRPDTALSIIRAKRSLNEKHFGVTIGKSAMRAAVDLSVRFLPDRRLPDKAQDVLEEAASRVAARRRKIVTRRDVQEVVQEWSGVPIRSGRQEAVHLLELEKNLGGRVFGQDEAVGMTARSVRRARAKMLRGGAKRPGSMLFLGPTGVGKTELAKALAFELFGDESAALSFDMSEYAEKHTASLLVGSPNGYVNSDDGGRLTNAVRARPFQVIVLDEIEKAHPDVINLLLQVLEEGRLSDRWGTVDFKNTIIVMTSNAIRELPKARQQLGFVTGRGESGGEATEPGDAALRRALIGLGWRPELVNRVDGAALFNKLDARSLDAIVDKTLREVGRSYGVGIRASRAAKDELLRRGTDPEFGARPIRRAAQAVEDVVADSVLSGSRDAELDLDFAGGRFLAKGTARRTRPARKTTRVNPQLEQRLQARKAAGGKAR